MKRFFIGLLFLSIPVLLYAQAQDRRISDNGTDILNVNEDGSVTVTTTNEANTVTVGGSKDYRISDNDGDVLNINEDGSITLTIVG